MHILLTITFIRIDKNYSLVMFIPSSTIFRQSSNLEIAFLGVGNVTTDQ